MYHYTYFYNYSYHEPHGIYYYNPKINVKQWDHPLDAEYKQLVEKVRKQHQQHTDTSETSQPDSGIKSLQGNEDSELINDTSSQQSIITRNSMDKFTTYTNRLLTPIERRTTTNNFKSQSSSDTPSITKNKRFEVTNYANNQNPPQINLQMKSDDMVRNTSSAFLRDEPISQSFKGLTLSGMGSMFLKSKKTEGQITTTPTMATAEPIDIEHKTMSGYDSIFDSPTMKQMKPVSEHIGSPTVKSILRDSSLTDVRNKQQIEQRVVSVDFEDRKSVRFNLDRKMDGKKLSKDESSDDDDDENEEWDFMEGEETFVKDVKLTPTKNTSKPMLKSHLSLDEVPKSSATNKLSVLSRTFSSDSAASADKSSLSSLFERQLQFAKPLYEDTDSETDLGAVKRFAKKIEAFDRSNDLSMKKIDNNDIAAEEQIERAELRQMMSQRISIFRKQLKKEQSEEEARIRQQMQTDLMKMKQDLSERNRNELKSSELVEFRQNNEYELKETLDKEKAKFQIELNEAVEKIRADHTNHMNVELRKEQEILANALELKKKDLLDRQTEEIEKIQKSFVNEIHETKANLKAKHNLAIDEYNNQLQIEFESKRKTISDEHRASVEILQRNHTEILQDLERDLKSEEDLVRKEHATNLVQLKAKLSHELEFERQRMKESGENHLYEKIRCEKRLLEDKYRCLKEKYVRLKADVKMSLERRNRRREQQSVATGSETERSNSNKQSIGNSDVKSASLSATPHVNTDHGRPPLTPKHQGKIRDTFREKSVDRDTMAKDKKFGAAAKYLSHIQQQQYADDTTSISQSDTTVSNNYNRARYLPVQPALADNGNSDSEAFKRNQENNNVAAARDTPGRQRKKLFTRMKSASTSRLNSSNNRAAVVIESVRPCTPVESLRRQLQKLEDLEDQFPDNTLDTTYHLRYPFKDVCKEHAGTSSELEFFKHRIHMERDSVRRAKESLRTQRTNFRLRQREIKQRHKSTARHTIDQLIQEEKELTEMEVNLHRTRALLGEKVIRLRHLEQSLQRICGKDKSNVGGGAAAAAGAVDDDTAPDESKCNKEDATISDLSSHSSSGFSSTDFGSETNHGNAALKRRAMYQESSAIIQSLDNLNTEIREIWEILSKQQSHCKYYFNF